MPVTTETPVTDVPTTEAPDYPIGFTTVDESYFSDALFIGNSLTDGLCLYDPMGSAKHFSAASATIFGILDMTDEFYGPAPGRDLRQNLYQARHQRMRL